MNSECGIWNAEFTKPRSSWAPPAFIPHFTFRIPRSRRGLSLVETLLALVIASALLTATMTALHASFHAYATAATVASTQSSTRMVMQRLLAMIRTGTVHDAYDPNNPAMTLGLPAAAPVQSVGIQMLDSQGQTVKVWWKLNAAYGDANLGDLYYQLNASAAAPLLERVGCKRTATHAAYLFTLASKASTAGLLLARATVDLTVQAVSDSTLSLETSRAAAEPVQMTGSTMPRRNL